MNWSVFLRQHNLRLWILLCFLGYLLVFLWWRQALAGDTNGSVLFSSSSSSRGSDSSGSGRGSDISSDQTLDSTFIPTYTTSEESTYQNCAKGLTNLRKMSTNAFENTILNDYVTFHWRPCQEDWKMPHGSLEQSLLLTPPPIFHMFDWVVWQHDRKNRKSLIVLGNHSQNNNPRTILVYPDIKATGHLKTYLRKVSPLKLGERRTLVLAGQDSGLGGKLQNYIHRHFLDYFSDIWCTAKNRPDPYVHAIPLGLNPFYVVKAGVFDVTKIVHSPSEVLPSIWSRITSSSSQVTKTHVSNTISTAAEAEDEIIITTTKSTEDTKNQKLAETAAVTTAVSTSTISDKNEVSSIKNESHSRRLWSFGPLVQDMLSPPRPRDKLVFAAWGRVWRHLDGTLKDRISLVAFLEQPETKAWLQRSEFSMLEYWEKLSEYKYSICPPGNGVQTPKIFEAILSHTVPVTLKRPAFEDLKKIGLPILLVDEWTDLSESLLEMSYEDEFQSVDWEKAKHLFSLSGIMDLILNWEETIPRQSAWRNQVSNKALRLPPQAFSPHTHTRNFHQKKNGGFLKNPVQVSSMMNTNGQTKKAFGNHSMSMRNVVVLDPGPKHKCDTQLRLQSQGITINNNDNYNPFSGTILNKVVSYHWRPCHALWNEFKPGSASHSLIATPPKIFNLFDWVIWQHDFEDTTPYVVFANTTADLQMPRTILVHPEEASLSHLCRLLKALVNKRQSDDERRTLVIAGQDTGLGGHLQYQIHRYLLDYFSDIWCTAKDRVDPFVLTIPLGLNPYYLVKAGVQAVSSVLKNDSHYRHNRKLVFTAWGSMWRFLDDTLKDRISLVSFLALNSTQTWLKRSEFSMLEYWEKLSEYKYSICPPGNGVQTPKIFEAILSHTVPVTLRRPAFEDLKRLGIPLLLVDEWTDLSVPLLETSFEKEFQFVNWEKAKYLISPAGIMELILQWNISTIPLKSNKRMAISKKTMHYYLMNNKNMH